MIRSLQVLRALGATMIFIHHFGYENKIIGAFGDCVVDWFIMLSGFMLARSYEYKFSELTAPPHLSIDIVAQFLKKRFIRLAPMYYVGIIIMLFFCKFNISPKPLGANLLMIQSWFNNEDIYFALNGPTWFISDLIFCYALFLPIIILKYYKPFFAYTILLLSCATFIICTELIEKGSAQYWLYIFPVAQFIPFMIGVFLWDIIKVADAVKLSPWISNIVVTGAFICVIVALIFWKSVDVSFAKNVFWWLPTSLLLVSFTLCDKVDCTIIKILHWNPLIKLGNAGMSYYILHLPWILTTHKITDLLNVDSQSVTALVISSVTLWVVALAIHKRFFSTRI